MALTEEGIIHVPGLQSRFVKLANGARAHYVSAGDTGPSIVLLHGGIVGSSGMAGWRFMLPVLAASGFRVYAPDRPGFGFSDTREAYWPTLGWKSYVDFVEDFADSLCIDRFYIGGNSNGTQNSIYFMVNNPTRVIAAALVATAGLAPMAGADASAMIRRPPAANAPRFDGTKESMKALLEPIIYRKETLGDDLLEMRTIAANMQKDSQAARALNQAQADPNTEQYLDLANRLRRLTIPMIYLHGKQDVLAPVENAALAEPLLPNIQFFYPDECGHQGQTDQPDMFNQVFLEFFRDSKVSRKTAEWAGVSKNRPELPSVEQAEPVRA